nr:thymidylate synthase [Candidatus Sigynarchaeum springense]
MRLSPRANHLKVAGLVRVIQSHSLLDAWKQAVRTILAEGRAGTDDGQPIMEFLDLYLETRDPAPESMIAEVDPQMAAWMHVNFTEKKPVPELGNAKSYATRLYDYYGKDQVATVVEKLRAKPETKSATITTLMPNDDTNYIPCVSLLDFKVRDGTLVLTATCRSLDFGKKALHNLAELAAIGREVQAATKVPRLALHVHAISAHVYQKDVDSLSL